MAFNLRLIPLLPFLGAALLLLFGRRWKRDTVVVVAATAIAAACLVAIDAYFSKLPEAAEMGGLRDVVWTWFSAGELKIDLAFRLDALSGLLCLIITFIGFLIHVYASGYMAHEADYARFFGYLNLFCGAMLVLVLGDNLPVMFIGWEGVGLCSYLLIGFWYTDNANANAGRKAFITNRIGDFGFLLGMFLLFQYTGTLNFGDLGNGAALTQPLWGQSVAFWVCLFLFIGATGKSAQIPLYVWLPDAMAGPTPVSALIHAATMVTAGVYMVARLHVLFMLAPAALAIVAIVGALTALFAAIIGFAQTDFKKVLAYSTVSQLGFMFAGVGTGNFEAGVFHLYTHAFFKAGLFLCAGSVMHAMSGSGDITIMGGLRKKVPWTHGVFFVCWLAICGLPIFSGFFSKDAIISGAFATEIYGPDLFWVGKLVGAMLMLAALGTAFYMSRLYFLVFSGDKTRASHEIQHHIHESPGVMVGPLVILAVGAGLGGLIGAPTGLFGHPEWNFLAHTLEPAIGPELDVPRTTEIVFMLASAALALGGIGLAYVFYGGGYRQPALSFAKAVPGLVTLVYEKFRVDELYDFLFVRPLKKLSRGLFFVVDRIIIDKLLVEGVGALVDLVGRLARLFQSGDSQRYMAVFAVGVALIVVFATRPTTPSELKVHVSGRSVDVDARRGGRPSARPLEYTFDFNGDGKTDSKGTNPEAHYAYEKAGRYDIKVSVVDPRWGTESSLTRTIEVP
ncbi:MAG TPA: NADH-quinone oxidoreductase subunit L [Polyangia bacterium]|jgi:NADH-quinone oxidoreductase subunit L|nr:NADH-quinone oxidoreductase subunit L [Polyangia bacterium]